MKNGKRLFVLLLAAAMMLSLCGCCKHEFAEATCTEGQICKLCGKEEGSPLGHTPVPYSLEPTCTEDGAANGEVCSACGEILTEPEILSALGHDAVEDAMVHASAEGSGLTAGSHCARCGEVLQPQEEIVLSEEDALYAEALGHYLRREYDEAYALVKDCKDSDNPKLRGLLGAMHYFGHGTAENNSAAFNNFSAASEGGYAYADWLLGECYLQGYGTKKDADLSAQQYEKGFAELEALQKETVIREERALVSSVLSDIYAKEMGGVVEENLEKAFEYTADGAEHGSLSAKLFLGVFYFNGYGTEKNYEEAFRLFEELLETNDPDAMLMLSVMYKYGLACEADPEKCTELRARAKKAGLYADLCGEQDYYLYLGGYGGEHYYSYTIFVPES